MKFKEILEVPQLFIQVFEYKLVDLNHVISRDNYKNKNPSDYMRELVNFIFDNLEKPFLVPTENYVR